jgi:hypothetical protein
MYISNIFSVLCGPPAYTAVATSQKSRRNATSPCLLFCPSRRSTRSPDGDFFLLFFHAPPPIVGRNFIFHRWLAGFTKAGFDFTVRQIGGVSWVRVHGCYSGIRHALLTCAPQAEPRYSLPSIPSPLVVTLYISISFPSFIIPITSPVSPHTRSSSHRAPKGPWGVVPPVTLLSLTAAWLHVAPHQRSHLFRSHNVNNFTRIARLFNSSPSLAPSHHLLT